MQDVLTSAQLEQISSSINNLSKEKISITDINGVQNNIMLFGSDTSNKTIITDSNKQIVSTVSTNDNIPTNNAIINYVQAKTSSFITEADLPEEVNLSGYAKITYVDEQISTKVSTSSIVDTVSTNDNVPTNNAVINYVQPIQQQLTNNTNNIKTLTGDVNTVGSVDYKIANAPFGNANIIYQEEFPPETSSGNLYINKDGLTKYYFADDSFIDLSIIVVDSIINADNNSVPTCKAIVDYVEIMSGKNYVQGTGINIEKSTLTQDYIVKALINTGMNRDDGYLGLDEDGFYTQGIKSDINSASSYALERSNLYTDEQVSAKLETKKLSEQLTTTNYNTADNIIYIDSNNKVKLNGDILSMPVIDSLYNSDYYTHDYIPSVSAVIEYINNATASNVSAVSAESLGETANTEVFINKLTFGEIRDNINWNDTELIITHNLICQFPVVQVFITDPNTSKYTYHNVSWYVNDGDANTVYIDCSEYTDKLITVKIKK